MNIIVLAGGISTEREVSIVTGTKVCQALRDRGHQAAILDVYFGTQNPEAVFTEQYDFEQAVAEIQQYSPKLEETKKTKKMFWGDHVIELCQKADIVFMALHGEDGENGKVQASFDLLGIKYTGTGYLGSALAMDKGLSAIMLNHSGVPTPYGFVMKKGEGMEKFDQFKMEYPCIVKPVCGGSSIGVVVVQKEEELEGALAEAFSYEDEIRVERFVKGREFSVGVVKGKAYPIIEIVPKTGFYDYKNKYQAGATDEYCPAALSEEETKRMQSLAEQAAQALMLHKYCRIDFMMDEDGSMYCLEANTLPGMTPTSLLPQEAAALGIDYGTLCETLIEVSNEES